MTEKKIKLNATNEVQEFVNAASECNFDINLHYQRAIVDAKSFLGVLSLGLASAACNMLGGYIGAGLVMKNGSKIARPSIVFVLFLLALKALGIY